MRRKRTGRFRIGTSGYQYDRRISPIYGFTDGATAAAIQRALAAHARRVREHIGNGLDVYAYFNNDIGGHAVRNALDLRRYVEGVRQRAVA